MALNDPLTTKRLMMQSPVAEDAFFIRDLISDPDVRHFLGGPVLDEHLDSWISRNLVCRHEAAIWVVKIKDTRSPIGLISITNHQDCADKELSFQFEVAAWGIGYATEATLCVLDHAINSCGVSHLIAETQFANKSSCRLLERIGMKERCRVERFGAEQIIYSSFESCK